MKIKLALVSCAVAASLLAPPAEAQVALVRVGQLVGTGARLTAGDLSFGNFTLPSLPVAASPPLDGVGDIAASASVNDDGTVSLSFTAIDPATGTALPIVGPALKAIAYDVTVTNPARLLSTVNQRFGPATTAAFNILTYRAPPPSPFKGTQGIAGVYTTEDTLISDKSSNVLVSGTTMNTLRTGSLLDAACPYFFASGAADPGGCASPLPGGYRAGLGLHNFFGIVLDRHSFISTPGFPSSVFDSVTMTFTLVPAATPVTPIAVNLSGINVGVPGIAQVSLGRTVAADGLSHPGFAPAGGIPVVLTTSHAGALPLPPTVTMQQGSSTTIIAIGDPAIDVPTVVNATASYNGLTVQQTLTISPTVPLTLLPLGGSFSQGGALTGFGLNRVNYAPAVVSLSSSAPAVAPLPSSVTIAPLAQTTGYLTIPFQPVASDTAVTFTASFNGQVQTKTFTIAKTVDTVAITRAELTVKNGGLRVDASSNVAAATLSLSNAATGQAIGTMVNLGRGKFSFQGTASPVVTLQLNSSFSGTATAGVAQK